MAEVFSLIWDLQIEVKKYTNIKMEIDSPEWDEICRICLQEGQLYSVFDFDDEKSDLNIAEKIMQCSPILVCFVILICWLFYGNHLLLLLKMIIPILN